MPAFNTLGKLGLSLQTAEVDSVNGRKPMAKGTTEHRLKE